MVDAINISFLNKKKILITGATGLIGYNLCKFLQSKINCEIHINYQSDIEPHFLDVFSINNVTHHRFDISNISNIDKLPQFDVIFHLSGYGQPKLFVQNPEKTFSLNTLSLIALLKKVSHNGHFLFMSSSELYANSSSTHEDGLICIDHENIRNCYILGKLCGEQSLKWAIENHRPDINYKIVRICLAYGPGFKRQDARVLSELIFKGINDKKIKLMDDGSAIRRYIYIDDAIQMILNILLNGKNHIYNVGGKSSITIRYLAEVISKYTGAEIEFGDVSKKLKNSPDFAGVDITKYESEFPSVDFISIEKGIEQCVKWANYIK